MQPDIPLPTRAAGAPHTASGAQATAATRASPTSLARAAQRRERRDAWLIRAWQFGILAVFLFLWETLTRIPWFVEHTFLDPFFISQPSRVIDRVWAWTLGAQAGFVWPHLASTLTATLIGLVVSVVTGFVAGLLLSQNLRVARVCNPFIVATNSLPRIAFVPLITMIFGLGLLSKVVTAWFLVFFLVFFNTFKGGCSIEPHLVNFCRTLGASRHQLMWTVRIPHAMAWTFAALPNAVAFSLVGVVIAEFVGSTVGMGYLIVTSLATLNATDMFATITLLSVLGIVLVALISRAERALLHWSSEFRTH